MDRTVPSRQLSRAGFARATGADDGEIRALLRAVPMEGGLEIGFEREPSYFACPAPAGIREHTLVARRKGRLLSVGSWSVREAWLGGVPARAGYLHGLRMAPGTSGSMRVLREGYARLAQEASDIPVAGWFTSVDAGNSRARRIFESRASGLPRYRPLAEYVTRLVPVSRRGMVGHGDPVETEDELTNFLNHSGEGYDLALTWDGPRWRGLGQSGFTRNDIHVIRRGGRIIAAAGVWDQSAWKQVVVHGYPRWVRRIRPLLGMSAACVGWSGLPPEGGRVPLACVFPFAVDEGRDEVIPELWRGVEAIARARGISWLALGLDAADPLWQKLRRVGISYRTVLYSVCGGGFPEGRLDSGNRVLRPECALL
jgi:hypothetical protein